MSKIENDFEGLYNVGWVTADGTWGEGGIVLFHPDNLTEFQYEVLDSLADSEKMLYVLAIVNGNENDLAEYENEYRESREN